MIAEAKATGTEADRYFAACITAKAYILENTKGARSVSGFMECPICHSGTLKYSVAFNGHIWAGCSTKDCVRFLE